MAIFHFNVWVKPYTEVVKKIAAWGHEIGNNTLTHLHMNRIPAEEIHSELRDPDDQVEALTGKRTTLFRAPFCEHNDTVVSTVCDMGCEIMQQNIDTVNRKKGCSAETILNAVLRRLSDGSVILSHNNGFNIETYLPYLDEDNCKREYRQLLFADFYREEQTITRLSHDSFSESQQNRRKRPVKMLQQASLLPSEQSYRVKDAEKAQTIWAYQNRRVKKRKTLTLYQNKRLNIVAGEIFIKYADEFFPFLFGREGSFDPKGAYLSIV